MRNTMIIYITSENLSYRRGELEEGCKDSLNIGRIPSSEFQFTDWFFYN
jgi:hypothetical protein